MGFVITYEPDNDALPQRWTRQKLALKLQCHINTIRNYELLIKSWIDDAAKYYCNSNPNKLESVPLTPYLIWLICQVRNLRRTKTNDEIKAYLFANQKLFSEKEFERYVTSQSTKIKRIAAA